MKGCLSIDISDWETKGILSGRSARDALSREEIKDDVVAQITGSLSPELARVLDASNIHTWFLDSDIVLPNPSGTVNLEPLLINTAGSWQYRPEAATAIENFFLAADFVRTYTDLATMEGANEAARRAVNSILARTASSAAPCPVWPLREPLILLPLREYDLLRFKLGLPHSSIGTIRRPAASLEALPQQAPSFREDDAATAEMSRYEPPPVVALTRHITTVSVFAAASTCPLPAEVPPPKSAAG